MSDDIYRRKILKYKNKYDHLFNQLKQKAGKKTKEEDSKKIVSKSLDSLTTNGPLIMEDTKVTTKLLIHGTLNFTKLTVLGTTKVYGTVIGSEGNFNTFSVYGSANVENCTAKKLLCTGPFYGEKIFVTNSSSIIGPTYFSNCKIKSLELISNDITVNNCQIGVLVLHSSDSEIKTAFNSSVISTFIVKGKKLTINANIDTKVENMVNGEIAVLNE